MYGSMFSHQETIQIVNFASNIKYLSDDKARSIDQSRSVEKDKSSKNSNHKRFLIWNKDITSYKNEETKRKIEKLMSKEVASEKIEYVSFHNIEITDPNMNYKNRNIDILMAFPVAEEVIVVNHAEKYHDSHICINISIPDISS